MRGIVKDGPMSSRSTWAFMLRGGQGIMVREGEKRVEGA